MRAIFTIGHSTRPIEEFLELLEVNGVEQLIDIRRVPRSRRNPQFNREALPEPLAAAGIVYLHMPEFGGLRHPRKDSHNGAWRCHRSLVADALTARGMAVEDIISGSPRTSHKLTPFARVEGARVWYPGLAD